MPLTPSYTQGASSEADTWYLPLSLLFSVTTDAALQLHLTQMPKESESTGEGLGHQRNVNAENDGRSH